MTKTEEFEARQELKALVDNYATESDKNNQDYYVHVFTPDCHVQVISDRRSGWTFTMCRTSFGNIKDSGLPRNPST